MMLYELWKSEIMFMGFVLNMQQKRCRGLKGMESLESDSE